MTETRRDGEKDRGRRKEVSGHWTIARPTSRCKQWHDGDRSTERRTTRLGYVENGNSPPNTQMTEDEEELEYKPEGVVCSRVRQCLWRVEPGRTAAWQPGQLLERSQHTSLQRTGQCQHTLVTVTSPMSTHLAIVNSLMSTHLPTANSPLKQGHWKFQLQCPHTWL